MLKITKHLKKDALIVTFFGLVDNDNRGDKFYHLLKDETAGAYKRLVLNFRCVSYMNSSGIKCIIKFLRETISNNIDVAVVYDNKYIWQDITFESIRIMMPGLRLEPVC